MKSVNFATHLVSDSTCSRRLRIAFVKQDCYPDLYIGGTHDSPLDLLKSTQLRIGPLALFSRFEADYYITKYTDKEDLGFHLYQNQSPLSRREIQLISNGRAEDLRPNLYTQSTKKHSDYSVLEDQVDWSSYDIIFCVNVSISLSVRLKFSNVFWILIPSDCNFPIANIGFDAYLTHRFASSPTPNGLSLQLPYTILYSTTLTSLLQKNYSKPGILPDSIYIEINSSSVRPPCLESIPFINELQKLNMPIIVHTNEINSHLESLLLSKYFIKTGGRPVNANSFAEAISSSCLVLCCYNDNFSNLLLPDQCVFSSVKDLIDFILYLESDPGLYERLLFAQKQILDQQLNLGLRQLETLFNTKHQKSVRNPSTFGVISTLFRKPIYQLSYLAYKYFRRLSVQPSKYFW